MFGSEMPDDSIKQPNSKPKNADRQTAFSMPVYLRIENDLRAKVETGHWAKGVMLPGRKTLAAQYGVSVPTIERAVASLLADGTLRADGRRGTFAGAAATSSLAVPMAHRASATKPSRSIANSSSVAPEAGISQLTVGVVAAMTPAEHDKAYNKMWSYIVVSSIEREVTRQHGRSACFNLWAPDHGQHPSLLGYEHVKSLGADAVIFVYAREPANGLLQSIDCPAIFVDDKRQNPPCVTVYYDVVEDGFQAASHLIAQGCTRILYVSAHSASWAVARIDGVRIAMRDANLSRDSLTIRMADGMGPGSVPVYDHTRHAYEHVARLLATEDRDLLTDRIGVITANDQTAHGLMTAAAGHNLLAGTDYLVIGFDDNEVSRDLGLSTVRPPLEDLGREAARLAMQAAQGIIAPMSCCLHSSLIARASSRVDS